MTDPGRSKEALSNFERVLVRQLAFRQRSLGLDHPGTLRTMDRLAQTLQSLGNHRHARMLRREALSVRQRRPR